MIDPQAMPEEYVLDTLRLRRFIETVKQIRAGRDEPHEIVEAIRPHFAELLADQTWLPGEYQEPSQGGGMGGQIGMWLLYRGEGGGLAFSALVVPPGQETPVHDHLAWGLVGLYRGAQEEEVFARRDDGSVESRAELELIQQNSLRPGDFYELLPENDIHRVRSTSDVTSVSLHLLGNDNGCIWRHRFHPEEHRVESFRSGWLNVDCRQDDASAPA